MWFKCAVVAMPFVGTVLDVSAWYMTKLYAWFAWVVMDAGAIMALCFAFMWVVSMYQLWFSPASSQAARREGGNVG